MKEFTLKKIKKQIDAFIVFIIKELDELDSGPFNAEEVKIVGLRQILKDKK